jgi:hypothetical protein
MPTKEKTGMSTQQSYDDATRAKAQELASRLKNDPGFKQQIEQDPIAALTGAGLSESAAFDFLHDVGQTPDVSGYRGCTSTCDSTCVLTCIVTSW